MEDQIHPRRYFALQVQCLLLLMDEIHTHIACRACAENAVCGVSGKSLVLEAAVRPKRYFVCQLKWLHYLSAFTKIKSTGE